jgi:chorismate-pyruvate lyase
MSGASEGLLMDSPPVEHNSTQASEATMADSLLWPLNLFYSADGCARPSITPLFANQIPQPYRRLLVHENDMTPTLEAFHGGTIHLERLQFIDGKNETTREVILRMDGSEEPVEYGASRIFLDQLNADARERVAEGVLPVGTILARCNCPHSARPGGFFRVAPIPIFDRAFGMPCEGSLYGRRNTLVSPDGNPITDVCEIMPPRERLNRGEGKQ